MEHSPEDSDTEEKVMSLRRKGKEIVVQDVIHVDTDEYLYMSNEVKLGGSYKGKDSLYVPDVGDSNDKKAPLFMKQSSSSTSAATNGIVNGSHPNNFTEPSSDTDQDAYNFLVNDDDDEHLSQNGWYGMDEIYKLQALFDKADIPPGVEAVIPWWSEPSQNNGKPFKLRCPSDSSSTRPMLGPGLEQTAHSHDTKSMGGTPSSVGFSYSNGSKSVPSKHGSIRNNHVAGSNVPAPTEFPGGSSGTSATNLRDAAMMRLQQFENFAVVDDYSDHRFKTMSLKTQLEKASAKKIQDEWRILQSCLPDTIFVRAYESRMNLLRAVIIGPQGTPYHDGLFFFDVMFPSTYPDQPPHVHYRSGGLRINPNLYENGTVCLSLLGTWPGRNATENWIPGKSTLLQILVSIQALILNAEPYFNEPGHLSIGESIYGVSASERYNEGALIKSLKTMIFSMRNPPKQFEEFVADHFITRSHDILLACKAYMDGAQVGSISIVNGKAVRQNDKRGVFYSTHDIGYMMNNLIDEFAKLGVYDCDEFRVPESRTKEPAEDYMGPTWFKISQSPAQVMSNFGSGNYMPAPFPRVPYPFPLRPTGGMRALPFPPAIGFAHPFPLHPTDMYTAAPHPPSPGDHAHPIRRPPPLPTMTPPFPLHPGVAAYQTHFPHIGTSSSSEPPSLPVHASPPVRIRPTTSNDRPNRLRPHLRNYPRQRPSKPDLNGNVHKWSDD